MSESVARRSGRAALAHGLDDRAVVQPVEFAADRHAAGERGDLDARAGQTLCDIVGGRLAIDRGRQGQHHLFRLAAAHPTDQFRHPQGVGPDALRVAELVGRVRGGEAKEVVLALPATVDGQTTAHYVAERLAGSGVEITSLARGVPVGGELDWLDDGTIIQAMRQRRPT